jgi:hypothetical protein
MPLKVTVNVFSGRENPSFTLSDANTKKLLDQLSLGKFKKQTAKTNPFPSVLGYSGLVVEQTGKKLTEALPNSFYLSHDSLFTNEATIAEADMGVDFKALIFDNLANAKSIEDVKDWKKIIDKGMDDYLQKRPLYIKNHFKYFDKTLAEFLNPIQFKTCFCSPLPDLDNWNGSFQGMNNCYNYGTNYRSDTFAQPGRAASSQYTSLASCNPAGQVSAKQGAISDGLIELPTNNNTCPKTGHLAALVNWPNGDFHWYRKGSNGKWSHKPGGTAATILDNSGNPITDPRTADRGNYTNFCSFMQVIHGHFKVK